MPRLFGREALSALNPEFSLRLKRSVNVDAKIKVHCTESIKRVLRTFHGNDLKIL